MLLEFSGLDFDSFTFYYVNHFIKQVPGIHRPALAVKPDPLPVLVAKVAPSDQQQAQHVDADMAVEGLALALKTDKVFKVS